MSSISVEVGSHISSAIEPTDIVLGGDENAHVWPSVVRERMAAYRPSIIAVDSINPVFLKDGKVAPRDKTLIWTLLPGAPSELNGTEQLFVVAGDNTSGEPDLGLEDKGLELLTRLGLGYVAYQAFAGAYNLSRRDIKIPENPTEDDIKKRRELRKRQISRRQFIGSMGVAASVIFGYSGYFAAGLPGSEVQHLLQEVGAEGEELDLDRILNQGDIYTYVDGRTALLIAKLNDTIDRGSRGHIGSVVLGTGHLAHSEELLHNASLRDEYIRRHAELLFDKAGTVAWPPDFKPTWNELEAEGALNYHQEVQVFQVLEPDDKAFKANPRKEIDRVITLVDRFKSPSVVAATESIPEIPR